MSKIYRNNGNNTFSEQTSIILTGVSYSSVAWADYDNDSDMDILLCGSGITKIYRNNGDNTFTDQASLSLTGVTDGAVAWGDYDSDRDLDVLLTGRVGSSGIAQVYHSNGNSTFTEVTSISLTGVYNSSVAWGDYDNDGDLDIILAGNTGVEKVTKIYRNDGGNSFSEQTTILLTGVSFGSAIWADIDNNGRLDILLSGSSAGSNISKIYLNNYPTTNTPPSVPANLSASTEGLVVTFTWNKSTDNETPQNGLRYNLCIGSSPNSVNSLSPMSDRNTGFRRVINLGNTNNRNSWTIKGLIEGTYFWSVQAIDNSFSGTGFAPEQSFVLAVPVELVAFALNVDNNSVEIYWKTATEINSYGFEIERSMNGSDFNKIAFVAASGNSNSPKEYSFVDNYLLNGNYFYRLKQIDADGQFKYSEIKSVQILTIENYALMNNYPNPFNPSTTIEFQIPERNFVTLKICDMLGTEVATLINEEKPMGKYEINFDASKLSSGMYVYILQAGDFREMKKMILLK